MKILFVGASGDRYGADAVLCSIAAHVRASGADCTLVLPEDGPGREIAEQHGLRVEVFHTPVLRKADLNIRGIFRTAASFVPCWFSQLRMLRAERPDVVWVNTITIPLWILAARLGGCRVICHSHEIVGEPIWLRRLVYLPLFLANKVVAVSEAGRDDIVRAYRRLDRKIRVAVNPSFAVQGPLSVRPGAESAIVVIGRISARKGLGVLMEALESPQLSRLRPVVHVCGAAYRSPVAQQFASAVEARAAALDSVVQFHGYVPTRDALTMGGIVVVPSTDADPCPLVVAEAMTAGRAVVASSCGGIPEIAGGAALLVPPGRADALAAGLACVVADPAERGRLEKASLSRAKTLSAATYLAEMDSLIRVVLDGGPEGPADMPAAAEQSR